MHHTGAHKILHNGNPINEEIVKIDVNKHQHQHPYHRPNSDPTVSLIEGQNLHDRMLPPSSTNVCAFKIWVVMLAWIRLFLRGDEVIKLKHEDVVGGLAVFNINGSFE